MDELQLTLRFTILDGKIVEFRHLAERCMESARTKDSGTLQYDWFFSSDGAECVVRERYRDSAAVLQHAANLGELMPAIAAVATPDIEIYGTPSDQLLEAIASFAPRVYTPYQSL
jgi:quinol monooxygenase YgiN